MSAILMSPLRKGLAALAGLAFAVAAHAQTVTVTFTAGLLNNSSGTALPTGTLVLLVADTQNNGFGSLVPGSLTLGSLLNGDDQVLFRTTINSGAGGVQGALESATLSGNWNTGDALALIWLPGLTTESTSFGSGQSYGLFTATTPNTGDSWVTPPAGFSIQLNFLTSASSAGTYSDSLGNASLTAIPEPSTYAALAGAAMLGFAAWRRRGPRAQRTET